jgi:hypothetical protein
MNLDDQQELILLTKAVLGLKAEQNISSAWNVLPMLKNTKFWNKSTDRLDRKLLIEELGKNPKAMRKFIGIGVVAEQQIFRSLFATIGEKK